jgi:hypothetical protein
MNTRGQVFLKTKKIRGTFDKRMAVRNVLFVLAMCLFYLLGKHYQTIHTASADPTSKTMNIVKIDSIYYP